MKKMVLKKISLILVFVLLFFSLGMQSFAEEGSVYEEKHMQINLKDLNLSVLNGKQIIIQSKEDSILKSIKSNKEKNKLEEIIEKNQEIKDVLIDNLNKTHQL